MEKKLSVRQIGYVGIMLFGIFFGAGNLIFLVNMGQMAGGNVWWATLGFILTGVGLPILGIIALGVTDSSGAFEISSNVGKSFAYVFTILISFIMGPLLAIPRLAATSFQIGISPFLSSRYQQMGLIGFILVFFVVIFLLSYNRGRLLEYIGKFLTPLFLVLLAIIVVMSIVKPMGSPHFYHSMGEYAHSPLLSGFVEGYNTLDGAGSIAFGIVVVETVRGLGVKSPKQLAISIGKAGLIGGLMMAVVYVLLSCMGATSLGQFRPSANGGIALVQIATHYFGGYGNILLSLIVIVACLKTAIAMSSAFADTMSDIFPKFKYLPVLIFAVVMSALLATMGLTEMIRFVMPVLMIVYPFSICLILISLIKPLLRRPRIVYQMTTWWIAIPAILSGITTIPELAHAPVFSWLFKLNHILPMAQYGMGWVLFALVGLAIGLILSVKQAQKSFK
ncbi:branched-chain amino acid transport system II carrier protein [Fructilactobacillus fructivorans]|uniref:branched-chain amino acid transport system II carrier protein n=1 Tax=Fructilactobacillus fructivorans TaxID=1614 RepID=UPI0007148CFC|nr:branched-chain amino acid transport system II carrier protein [Fructilactobacillus fructivorans]KRN43013.1 branched-chain amino acid transport protein [Fructilactobacillus fructivorans]